MDSDLVFKLECALTHNIEVCESCKKCKGSNCAEIRLNLVKELCDATGIHVPWREEDE